MLSKEYDDGEVDEEYVQFITGKAILYFIEKLEKNIDKIMNELKNTKQFKNPSKDLIKGLNIYNFMILEHLIDCKEYYEKIVSEIENKLEEDDE